MTALKTRLLPVSDITPEQKQRMFQLMDTYYANVTWERFLQDLADKHWVLVLERDTDGLVGFSTQKFFTQVVQGREVGIVFSGDTVIERAHRKTPSLAWAFGRFMWEISQRDLSRPLYWMLITKGIRTFRYLPLYFREFYPRFDKSTPVEYSHLMDGLGKRFFPTCYDPSRGILTATANAPYLRDFDTPERDFLKNHPHYRFFYERNPGYRRGEELLCLAQFGKAFVRPAIWRCIEQQQTLFPQPSVFYRWDVNLHEYSVR